ncbi:MAG: metalloregulator ArsR/SmtB family transcription factor [Gaiellales bacterium]
MSTYVTDALPQLVALGDPTRRQVFEILRRGPASVGEIARQLPVSRPAVSQHLKLLLGARLVRFTQEGTRHLYTVDQRGVTELHLWLSQFWDDALDRFREAAEAERSIDEHDRSTRPD